MKSYQTALEDMGVDSDTAAQFIGWHQRNPEVWKAFEAFALKLIARGMKHYGAKAIMEVVRYDQALKSSGEFKVNNNYSAYYARIFTLKYPQHKDFFEFREVRGLKEIEPRERAY